MFKAGLFLGATTQHGITLIPLLQSTVSIFAPKHFIKMKAIASLLFLSMLSQFATAQTGIGTVTPNENAVLDLSASSKTLILPQIADVAGITNPVNGMVILSTQTNAVKLYENNTWKNLHVTNAMVGDIKMGVQPADHDGWILLDGRAVSSLTANQQLNAQSLGYTVNLPNATNKMLLGASTSYAINSSGGSALINQDNLPVVNLAAGKSISYTPSGSVSTDSAGSHSHGTIAEKGGGVTSSGSDWAVANDDGPGQTYNQFSTASAGSHSHPATFTGNDATLNLPALPLNAATQQPYMPPYIAFNTYLYLGN